MKIRYYLACSALALASTAPAFAQSTSVIDQNGSDLVVGVSQAGAGNVSEIDQDGTGLNADVTQNGDDNLSGIIQTDDSADLLDPSAVVDQQGNGNESNLVQSSTGNTGGTMTVQDGQLIDDRPGAFIINGANFPTIELSNASFWINIPTKRSGLGKTVTTTFSAPSARSASDRSNCRSPSILIAGSGGRLDGKKAV